MTTEVDSGNTSGSPPSSNSDTKAVPESRGINELSPKDRAQLGLAVGVLVGAALLMLVAWDYAIFDATSGIPEVLINACDPTQEGSHTWDPKGLCDTFGEWHQDQVASRTAVFEFAKSWIPPIITLVLGYYFARERE